MLLDVSALDQVLDHAGRRPDRRRPRPAPGSPTLQAVVGEAGQRLALDETVPGASIGGTLATNASGPQRVLVGTARDLLIGITVVRADGVVAKAGGRVVKNVAGYDLGKLMIGSFGTLAVVTEARLPAAPAAGGAALGHASPVDRPGRRARARAGGRRTRRPCPAADRGRLARRRAPAPSACCSRARDEGVEGRAATRADLLGEPSTESAEDRRRAGRRTPGTRRPPATTAPPRSS